MGRQILRNTNLGRQILRNTWPNLGRQILNKNGPWEGKLLIKMPGPSKVTRVKPQLKFEAIATRACVLGLWIGFCSNFCCVQVDMEWSLKAFCTIYKMHNEDKGVSQSCCAMIEQGKLGSETVVPVHWLEGMFSTMHFVRPPPPPPVNTNVLENRHRVNGVGRGEGQAVSVTTQ